MGYTLEQLHPCTPAINIDGYELGLSNIDLKTLVKFKKMYGDISEIYTMLKENPNMIINLMWYLVIDKHLFENRFHTFKELFLKEELEKLSKQCFLSWDECVVNSMPLVMNKKRQDDINKLKNSSEMQVPCYAKYFDALSKRYGFSLDSFYSLTLRQVTAMLETINDESYTELEVKASLAGKKLKPRIVFNNVSEEEEKEQDKQAEDAVARLQKEYEERLAKKQGSK